MNAGRPTVLTLGPKAAVRRLDRPEADLSHPERAAALRQHLRSARRRHLALARHQPPIRAERFQDEIAHGQFVDWPIGYEQARALVWRGGSRARRLRGQGRAGISRHQDFREHTRCRGSRNRRPIRPSATRCDNMTDDDIKFPGNGRRRSRRSGSGAFPAARNSAALPKPARLRRQHQLHSDLPDPGEIRSDHHAERRDGLPAS